MIKTAERKALSKKTRFEVFKRDRFTCQYCGRMSPDVILEVDHIKPVAKGGDNNFLNLITSCRDCNRGKSDKRLSDDVAIKKVQEQLLDMADKREQLQMMVDWKNELLDLTDDQTDCIAKLINKLTGYDVYDEGKRTIRKWLLNFSFNDVYDSTIIAFDRYYQEGKDRSFNIAFYKIGGICFNKQKQKAGENVGREE